MNWELAAFILYLIALVGIGLYFFTKSRGRGGEADYFLGGRNMNSSVTALSSQASDMSAWLLMGLPGAILAYGVGQVWIAVGLLIGTVLNWIFVAPRLRAFSKAADDAITIPQYLSNRFLASGKGLQVISALVFLVCYAVYAASSFKACGTLFNVVFGLDENFAIVLAAVVICAYTFLGGFTAVCWTDLIQGFLMLAALLIAPLLVVYMLSNGQVANGAGELVERTSIAAAEVGEQYWNLLPSGRFDWESVSTILSGLAWGLGYCGMPHVLVRFMSCRDVKTIKKSRNIAIVWVVFALSAAVAVGLLGRVFLPELAVDDRTLVFINMVRVLFPAFLSGLLLSGILAASMSTADSQLLVAASAFSSDIYKPVFRKKAGDREMNWVSRLLVMAITGAALAIALNPNSGDIMDLVENAWAGFGSSFGPVIVLSLFWKRFNYKGAVAGIVTGALVDVLWLVFLSEPTGLYELLPGFAAGLIASVAVTLLTKAPPEEVDALFERSLITEE
ncbi:MAG: sodium/proline symporter [Clostridiales bacterium]|nr:sodium/proline symporter [Clostridiales bacterium]